MLQYFYWALAITAVTTDTLREAARSNKDGRYIHRDTPRRVEIVHKMTQTTDQSQTFQNKPTLCEIIQDFANCSHQNISKIGELSLPDNITSLDLSVNHIEDIPDGALSNFTQLKSLNMSKNHIQKLNNGSFYNLKALQFLDLHSNNLSMDADTFPVGVFKPLVELTHLWIHNNTNVDDAMLDYPDTALSYLSNLTSLWIDGLPKKVFNEGFQSLTSLINLTLQGQPHGHCNLMSLPENMFDNLRNLRHLTLHRCNITGVNIWTFTPLTKLTLLDLTNNVDLHFDSLENALEMIVNYTNLTTLIIPTINNPYYPAICVTKAFANSLPRGLEILDITSNSIETLEHGALENLPKSLKYIYLNDNRFAFASYLKDLDKLENLLELSIATWNTHILPKYYPPEEHARTCGDVSRTAASSYNSYLTQPLPPKLQTIQVTNAGWSNYLDEFHFNPNNTLKHISLDWNNFPKLIGPIIGLNQLENISLMFCNIKEIHYTFFQNLTSLKSVNLAGNIFGDFIFPPGTPSPFIWLKSLTFLGLNFSDLQFISNDTFQGLNNLTTLSLDRNPIYNFDIELLNMTQLISINLSKTLLASFSSKTRKMLDQIHRISNLTVHFPGDKLTCQCSDLDFIQWMTTTSVLAKDTEYFCNDQDTLTRVSNLVELYKDMQRQCVTNYQLLSIVISCTCLLLIIMIAAIMYRLRWKLWYLYYGAILHYSGGNKTSNKTRNKKKFDFDVFISYAQEDHEFVVEMMYPELVSRGLKVHIHGLHFVAGQYISVNIVNAVQSSRRTLVVLTASHLRSKWSKFEIEMANIEQVHTGRSVLLFLILESLPKLNSKVLFHIKNNTYMKFPKASQDPLTMQMFWTRLVSDLQS